MKTDLDALEVLANKARADAEGAHQMVFDWDRAAQLIADRKPDVARAGLRGDWGWTGGQIYTAAGGPDTESYTYLSSNWARPQLDLDGDIIECWRLRDASGWDANTKWPPSALAILGGRPMTADEKRKEFEGRAGWRRGPAPDRHRVLAPRPDAHARPRRPRPVDRPGSPAARQRPDRTPAMTANLRTFLDLNTDHLPPRFYDSTTVCLTGGYHLEHGMLLWVPLPGECVGGDDDNAPEVVRLREYAREVGAEYVLLDRDAPHDPTLPIFDDDGEVERVETFKRVTP